MKFSCLFAFSCYLLLTVCSCNGGGKAANPESRAETEKPVHSRRSRISISSPGNNDKHVLGSEVVLSVQTKDSAVSIDSLRWFVDGKLLKKGTADEPITWNTSGQTTGSHRIEAVAHYPSGERDIVSVRILLTANKAPKQYTYKVVQTRPHDPKAYTQGLVFDEGFLYESTGLKGQSSLRKVNIETGEPVRVMNIPTEMFGEGLALVDGKLIQLTWQDQVAFVYGKDDFKLLRRINYSMREGWGLSYDGKHLILTDGSATLYFLDKDFLTEVRRIEVCDDKGPVLYLNESEYIEGELWVNVYQTDVILRIDPETGVVFGRINMQGLLKPSDYHSNIDVLNGIAYDKHTGKIFVTGKNWPKLFEIQVTEKK